jgi:hypothetical protein
MMLTSSLLLLAQVGPKAPKPGDWSFGWSGVGAVAAVSITIIFVLWLTTKWAAARKNKNSHSPWGLFTDLCTSHHLNRRERQLLTRLAQHCQLEHPSTLFIESAWWEPDRLGPAWLRCRPELEKLRKRLFAVR